MAAVIDHYNHGLEVSSVRLGFGSGGNLFRHAQGDYFFGRQFRSKCWNDHKESGEESDW